MPFVPKNAIQILRNSALQKDFFLKPYGLDVQICINVGTKKWTISKETPLI